jgi:hypothetical protein
MTQDHKHEIRALTREVLDEPGQPFGSRSTIKKRQRLRGNPHHGSGPSHAA